MTSLRFLAMLQLMAAFGIARGATYFVGGKNGAGVYQALINLMPPHDVYVEPFLGSGAVMKMKRPAGRNIGIDADAGVIARTREASWSWHRDFGGFRPEPPELAIQAFSAGIGDSDRQRSHIAATSERGSWVEFLNQCGTSWLERAMADPYGVFGDGARVLVYCDPPYLHSTRASRQRYAHEMTDVDHLRLLRVLRTLKCNVMISGYSSSLYARELKGWNATAFQAATRGAPAAEWVWYNFDPPLALHDYRYLGRDFRERARIRRQKQRWTARLERMPTLQRQALLSAIAELSGGGR